MKFKGKNKWISILAKQDFIMITIPSYESNLLVQPAIPGTIFSTTRYRSSLFSLSWCKEIPKYFVGEFPSKRWEMYKKVDIPIIYFPWE